MDYQAALKELYFKEWATIAWRLGAAIIKDDVSDLNALIEKYFSTPEARALLNGRIAYVPSEKKDEDGYVVVPAFLAQEKSSMKSLEAIIQVTGNPNARGDPDDPAGTPTLIFRASQLGNSEAVKLLMAYGADVNSKVQSEDGAKLTALGAAASNGYIKLARLLVESGAEITLDAAFAAIESEKTLSPILEYFVEQKPDLVGEVCRDGFNARTLLHHTCAQGNLPVARWLVGKGADINAPDADGQTPIDYAIGVKHSAIEKYLASIGAATKSEIDAGAPLQQSQVRHVEVKREITDLVDRLELLEDKCGIRLDGVYAVCSGMVLDGKEEYSVEVNCDIVGTGAELERSFNLRLNAYNSAGQLLKTDTIFIHKGDFSGFQSCSIRLYCDQFPHRLRLFPS